jgi:hypothetical protein
MNLSTCAKVTRVMNGVAAGQATNNGSSVDMKGFDSVTFVVLIGAITGGGTITLKAQQSSDNGVADGFSDLEGTAIAYTSDDDNKLAILEINCPLKRYVRPVVITATQNGVIDGVVALQTKPDSEPVTHDATTVLSAEFHHAPAEGTA